tara:strand:- start:286 stop:1023 length:738 start_codon:yes stop_codon:yes gene_type:complete
MLRARNQNKQWQNSVIGITGASGELGKALSKKFRSQGGYVIGLTHKKTREVQNSTPLDSPQEWVSWTCGKESLLENTLSKLDLLILNHGINPHGAQNYESLDKAIEVNALSTWRLIKEYEKIAFLNKHNRRKRQIWVNTSEAEVQPAFSPGYEISKRLIGELVSLRRNNLNQEDKKIIEIRKLILGPFKSELNPIGIMSSDFVAEQIIFQSKLNLSLIIVSPNPITYLSMPLAELTRSIYSRITK